MLLAYSRRNVGERTQAAKHFATVNASHAAGVYGRSAGIGLAVPKVYVFLLRARSHCANLRMTGACKSCAHGLHQWTTLG